MTPQGKLAPGERLGHLEIERELGQGAFGQVLLARDLAIGRQVVVKIVRPRGDAAADTAEALREARLVGNLNSPHIVTLHRVEELPDTAGWFLEMEYMPGGSLDDLLAAGRLPAERAEDIFRGLASALRAAHDRGVVHGDVKPANVLLGANGEAKLADFGLARLRDEASRGLRGIAGTPLYMAPEVLMGAGLRAESDVWSAGVVLYRMLSSRHPFPATSLDELFFAVQNEPPAALGEDVAERLAALALQTLAKRPEDRPPAAALVAAVEGRLGRSRPPRPTGGLVGREKEIEALERALAEAGRGRGRVVCVTGDLGLGKTALLEAFRGASGGGRVRWATLPLGRRAGFFALLAEATQRPIPGMAAPESSFESRGQLARAAEGLVEALCGGAPAVLAVEDLDHLEEDEGPLLEAVAKCTRRLPLLLVMTGSGSGETPGMRLIESVDDAERIRLEPLPWTAVARILEREPTAAAAAPELLATVAQRADGNPLFAIEMLRHLMERGITRVSQAGEDDLLPRQLRDLLRRRTAQLPSGSRELLEIAAVDGPRFDGEALAAVGGRPLLEVLRALQDLYRRTGLIAAEERGFRFTLGLTSAALYEDLAPEYRVALHRSLAEHLERRDDPDPERLGTHWERAGFKDRAEPCFREAAIIAGRRQELHRAVRLAQHGGIAAGKMDAPTALAHSELVFQLADAHAELGSSRDAEILHRAVLEAARVSGDRLLRLRCAVRLLRPMFFLRGKESIDRANLEEAVRDLPDSDERAQAHFMLGLLSKYAGDLDEAQRHLERANAIRKALGLRQRGDVLGQLAAVALRGGRSAEAEGLYAEAAELDARAGRRTNAAANRFNVVLARFQGGRVEGIEEAMEEERHLLALEGARHMVNQARVFQAEVRWARGDLAGALSMCREELDRHRPADYLPGIGLASRLLAELHLARGELGTADAALDEGRAAAERLGDIPSLACVLGIGALRRSVAGDREGAAKVAAEGLAACRRFSEARSRIWFALALVEGALYGVPAETLAVAAGLLDGLPETPLRESGLAAAAAAGAFAEGGTGSTEILRAGAEALRSRTIGDRRAVQRIVGQLLVAEASRREGDATGAQTAAAVARQDARSLGHVWLEAAALRLLARLDCGAHAGADLRALLERVAGVAGTAPELLLAAWARE